MYRDYRGLKKLIKELEIPSKDHDVHPSEVEASISSSIFKFCPSEVDPYADERSLERSEPQFQLPPLNFSVLNLSSKESPHKVAPERSFYFSTLSVNDKDSIQTSTFDISGDRTGGLTSFPGRCEFYTWTNSPILIIINSTKKYHREIFESYG